MVLLGLTATSNGRDRGYTLPPASHPPPITHPTPLPPVHPLICATHDITVAVKKVAQTPVVLAS